MKGCKVRDCKVTARIDEEIYQEIKDRFYHGQQTLFFKSVFKSLKVIIDEDLFDEINDYMYKGKPLTLPAIDKD